jgi:hypothetical protein
MDVVDVPALQRCSKQTPKRKNEMQLDVQEQNPSTTLYFAATFFFLLLQLTNTVRLHDHHHEENNRELH